MKSRLDRIVPLILLFVAAPAVAQNASTPGALDLYPNLQAAGVRLSYTGDANANATARIEWRPQGAASWSPGVNMTRITNQRWAGSVFWLDPDTPYDVRAIIEDPDGGGMVTGTLRTKRVPAAAPSGRTLWVDTGGNDANPGDATRPLATLQAAVNLAQAGDEVRVRPGIYYQTVDTPRSGTSSAFIYLTADAPGVILDGSDPAMLHRSDWRSDGGGVFSVPFANQVLLVCADSLQRLYHHASLSALQSSAYGITQGFAIEGGRLYVKLEDGSDPTAHTMHIARYLDAIYIHMSYWCVSGLEIRYYGTVTGSTGIELRGANGCWIYGNTTYALGGKGIWLRGDSNDNLVERNLCFDPRIGGWPWGACKSHDEEIQGISNYSRRGNVIRLNTVHGTFDGIDGGDTSSENDAADMDINDNVVTNICDDAFETELFDGINARIWRNRADEVYDCCSIAPNYVGPQYVIYNTFSNFRLRAFKFSISSTGQTWIYHNTATTKYTGTSTVWPSGPYSNKHFRNNILSGNNAECVSDDVGESQTGNDFDGDLLTSNYAALFRWKGVNYANLAAVRSGTGFEMNGRSGLPLFVSPGTGDYGLTPGSPAVDGGLLLPGINDRFSGAAPDIGALELSTGPDVIPPAAIRDFR